MDWKDPNKKVQPGDVLTLISASGTIAVTLLVWAEIGPGAAAAIGAVALSADLQSSFQPYLSSVKLWLGNVLGSTLQLASPVSSASSSLYWGGMPDGSGWNLYSYDELMSGKGLFACMTDDMVQGASIRIKGSPVPGSFTPVNESQYKADRCRYDFIQSNGSDESGWMMYCQGTMYR